MRKPLSILAAALLSAPFVAKADESVKPVASEMQTCPTIRVHFATDSADIPSADQPDLNEAATCLTQNHRLRVAVEGNTDARGTDEYNQKLGDERAQSVRRYLIDRGVSAEQLTAVSFGKDNPICNEKNPDCFAKNRRTAIRATCHL